MALGRLRTRRAHEVEREGAAGHQRGEGGLQIHRSWWVALDRIARIDREGRDYVVRLDSGVRIPVGRSRIAALKARGLV